MVCGIAQMIVVKKNNSGNSQNDEKTIDRQ